MVKNHVKVKGAQRLAVFRAMMYPASGAILFKRAKIDARNLTYFDLRKILRDFEVKGLICSMNPDAGNGRIYSLTPVGCNTYQKQFREFAYNKVFFRGDINIVSKILRQMLAKNIMHFLCSYINEGEYLSTPQIRKKLLNTYPASYNNVLKKLADLHTDGLVEMDYFDTKKHTEKRYRISPLGKAVNQEIDTMLKPPNSPNYKID